MDNIMDNNLDRQSMDDVVRKTLSLTIKDLYRLIKRRSNFDHDARFFILTDNLMILMLGIKTMISGILSNEIYLIENNKNLDPDLKKKKSIV